MTFNPQYSASIVIRDIETIAEMHQVEALERETWGCDDLDVLPATMFSATRAVGGVLIGAFDDNSLVGFVYGFPGLEDGELTHHSHMLAVRQSHRNFDLGYKLKLAQRQRVIAQGIKRITWTFDPLQSLNAYFNFRKLGVVADKYKIDFYGESTTSFLHQFGTDRLWVSWFVQSDRVRKRLNDDSYDPGVVSNVPLLVQVHDNEPLYGEMAKLLGEPYIAIEIPGAINKVQENNPALALRWRQATREAFTLALNSEYLVQDFFRLTRDSETLGVYVLSSKKITEFH